LLQQEKLAVVDTAGNSGQRALAALDLRAAAPDSREPAPNPRV
jgi:hypothetical protein